MLVVSLVCVLSTFVFGPCIVQCAKKKPQAVGAKSGVVGVGPSPTQSGVVGPGPTQPGVVGPGLTQPGVVEPAAAQPGPVGVGPVAGAKPEVVGPAAVQPGVAVEGNPVVKSNNDADPEPDKVLLQKTQKSKGVKVKDDEDTLKHVESLKPEKSEV